MCNEVCNEVCSELDINSHKEIVYITRSDKLVFNKEGLPNDPTLLGGNGNPFKITVIRFQQVEGATLYLQLYINDEKDTIQQIFEKMMDGSLDIYVRHHYGNGTNYLTNHGNIYNIESDELLLHYTQLRSNYLNVAWRTIKWDLFKDYVPK